MYGLYLRIPSHFVSLQKWGEGTHKFTKSTIDLEGAVALHRMIRYEVDTVISGLRQKIGNILALNDYYVDGIYLYHIKTEDKFSDCIFHFFVPVKEL